MLTLNDCSEAKLKPCRGMVVDKYFMFDNYNCSNSKI